MTYLVRLHCCTLCSTTTRRRSDLRLPRMIAALQDAGAQGPRNADLRQASDCVAGLRLVLVAGSLRRSACLASQPHSQSDRLGRSVGNSFTGGLLPIPIPSWTLVQFRVHELLLHALTPSPPTHICPSPRPTPQCTPRTAEKMHQRALLCYSRASALLQSQDAPQK